MKGFALFLSFKQVDLHKSDLLYLNLLLSVLGHCNTNLSTSSFPPLPQSTVWCLCIDTRTRAAQWGAQFAAFSDSSLQHKQKKYHNEQLQNDRLLSGFVHLAKIGLPCYLDDKIPLCFSSRKGWLPWLMLLTNGNFYSFNPYPVFFNNILVYVKIQKSK